MKPLTKLQYQAYMTIRLAGHASCDMVRRAIHRNAADPILQQLLKRDLIRQYGRDHYVVARVLTADEIGDNAVV
jgi:hypothetical protein